MTGRTGKVEARGVDLDVGGIAQPHWTGQAIDLNPG